MGSPEFAVASLDKVHQNTELLAVYTQPDKPRGRRGKDLEPTAVKKRALELGLPVHEPKRIRDEDVVAQLREYRPDAIFVVAYAKLIPPVILELPQHGCINVHPSLLPRYRGAIPLQASIFAGDSETGVCTFFMDEGYDTGDIIVMRRTELGSEETFSQLSARLALLGAEVLGETIELLRQGKAPRLKQPAEAEGGYTKPLSKADLMIDWSRPAETVRNMIRGLADEPGAATTLSNGEALKVARASFIEQSGQPGEVLGLQKGRGPIVACGQHAVILEKVKPAGKGWMDGASLWNGGKVAKGQLLGQGAPAPEGATR
jgi:methionyl-tRNA formyltransferase